MKNSMKLVCCNFYFNVEKHAGIEERAVKEINLLKPYRDKLYVITDGVMVGLQPLTPSVIGEWILNEV